MYDNIGEKIKGLAKGIFVFEAIAAFIAGIALMAIDDDLVLVGFLIMVLVPVVAWVSSWILYGFGELITKTCQIEANTRGAVNASQQKSEANAEKIKKINDLYSQGLLTEEEYKEAILRNQ